MIESQPELLVGVNVGINRVHTVITQEEEDGKFILRGEYRSRDIIPERDKDTLIESVRQSILEALHDARVDPDDLLGIGVAVPGQVSQDNQTLLFAPNLELSNVPLAAALKKLFDCPCVIINDVVSQGIGEQRIGAGKHIKHLVYLYVSYGIGSSIIIDGKPYNGADNLAGEFGHTAVSLEGPKCSCGQTGCLEAFSSKHAILKNLQISFEQGNDTILANMVDDLLENSLDLSPAIMAEAIDQEDELTIRVVEEAAKAFGVGIASIINLINPEMIILGGEVVDDIDQFFEQAIATARKRCLSNNGKNIIITRGILGTTAGAFGAALAAKDFIDRESQSITQNE
jgi:glucokinase